MKTPARNTSDPAQNPLVDVARVLSDVARSLEAEPDLHHTVGGIAAAVTDTVSGAEDAGVSLCEGESLRTVAATSDLVEIVNNLEHELNEGPGLDALHMRRTYRSMTCLTRGGGRDLPRLPKLTASNLCSDIGSLPVAERWEH